MGQERDHGWGQDEMVNVFGNMKHVTIIKHDSWNHHHCDPHHYHYKAWWPFLDGVISPSTAHEITPIHAFRVNVANAAPCAWHKKSDHFIPFYISSNDIMMIIMILTERANCVVCVTVVWRVLDEHQVICLEKNIITITTISIVIVITTITIITITTITNGDSPSSSRSLSPLESWGSSCEPWAVRSSSIALSSLRCTSPAGSRLQQHIGMMITVMMLNHTSPATLWWCDDNDDSTINTDQLFWRAPTAASRWSGCRSRRLRGTCMSPENFCQNTLIFM